MIRSLLTCALLLLSIVTLAQRQLPNPLPKMACGTSSPTKAQKALLERRMQAVLKLKRQLRMASGPTYVPIRINIVRRRDRSGMEQYTPALLSLWLGMANEQHRNAGTGLQFYYVGNGPNYIDSDERYDYTFDGSPEGEQLLTNGHVVNNALNLYIVACAGFGGMANFPTHDDVTTTRLYLARLSNLLPLDIQRYAGWTLAHELGHTFGLYHTFQDIDNPDVTQRELVTRTDRPGKLPPNCSEMGDLVCDTPADPYQIPNGSTGNESCGAPYMGTATDANGDPYTPLLDNVMSYYNLYFCGLGKFTGGQFSRMQTGLGIRQGHTSYAMNAPMNGQTAPRLVSAVATGTRLALTWQAGSGSSFGYIIERSNAATGPFTAIAGVEASATTFSDVTYNRNRQQFYRLRPADNPTVISNVVGSTSGCEGIPNTPLTGLAVNNLAATSATLQWDARAGVDYLVRWRMNYAGESWQQRLVSANSLDLTGLEHGTQYIWSVQPACGPVINGVSFRTVCPPPSNLTASLLTDAPDPVAYQLRWETFPRQFRYELAFRESGSTEPTQIQEVVTLFGFPTLSPLTPGSRYNWTIRAACPFNKSVAVPGPPLNTPIAAPTNPRTRDVTATAGTLEWDEVDGAMQYLVRWQQQSEPFSSTLVSGTSFTLTNLRPGTPYGWIVNAVGPLYRSATVPGPDLLTPCPPPTELTVTNITPSGATLNWQGQGVSYIVRHNARPIRGWTTLTPTAPTVTLSGLRANTAYQWQVRAVCTVLRSPFVAATSDFRTLSGAGRQAAPADVLAGQLQVDVLNNPTTAPTLDADIWGAAGQPLTVGLYDLQGRVLHEQRLEQPGEVQRIQVPFAVRAGTYLLRVGTATTQQTVKVLRP